MVKVSVVIPVYNVEPYLNICMDSVVNQTLKDIEIICINDGSTDKSLDILNSYAEKDDRITVISQENGGHAVATNKGMKLAQGKYLYLMDSDDMLDLEALEKTYNAAEEKQVDFVLFQAMNYDEATDRTYANEMYSMNRLADFVGDEIFDYKDIGDLAFTISVTPWTKLYNREFVEKCGASFPEGLIFEDNVFFWEVFFSAERIYFLKEHLFTRRWHDASSTRAGDKRFLDAIKVNDLILEVFEKFGLLDDEIYNVTAYNRKIKSNFNRLSLIKDEFKPLYFNEMQKNFKNWVSDEEFYDFLSTILTRRSKLILDETLTAKTYKELILTVQKYEAKREIKKLKRKNKKLKKQNKKLKKEYNKILNSNSWKSTEILRKLKRII